jgi:hypothetical protein
MTWKSKWKTLFLSSNDSFLSSLRSWRHMQSCKFKRVLNQKDGWQLKTHPGMPVGLELYGWDASLLLRGQGSSNPSNFMADKYELSSIKHGWCWNWSSIYRFQFIYYKYKWWILGALNKNLYHKKPRWLCSEQRDIFLHAIKTQNGSTQPTRNDLHGGNIFQLMFDSQKNYWNFTEVTKSSSQNRTN